MAGILGAGVAPAVVGSGILMPIKTLWTPQTVLMGNMVWFDGYLFIQHTNDRIYNSSFNTITEWSPL